MRLRQTRLAVSFPRYALLVALMAWSFYPLGQLQARVADKEPDYGRIKVSTTPGGFPLLIDGESVGKTTLEERLLDLPPGPHTVEIIFPDGDSWKREFNISARSRICITLGYQPRTVTIPPPGDVASSARSAIETVVLGEVGGTVCDCPEIYIPIPKTPWWIRAAAKAAGAVAGTVKSVVTKLKGKKQGSGP